VTVTPGEDDTDNNFVEEQLGTISGYVSEDTNNDDIGDLFLSGVTITLNGPGGVQTTTTDATGYYEFTGLVVGDYTVSEQDETLIDPDYVDVYDGDESNDGDANDGVLNQDDVIDVTLTPGEDDEDNNFVERFLPNLSITKVAGEPVAVGDGTYNISYTVMVSSIGKIGTTYNLSDTPKFDDDVVINSGSYSGQNSGSMNLTNGVSTTLANNQSIGASPAVHSYTVTFNVNLDFEDNIGDEEYTGCEGECDPEGGNKGLLNSATLSYDGNTEKDCDCEELPASVGNFVWEDKNANGIQNSGESGIQGVEVKLFDSNSNLIDTKFTGSMGEYLFVDLSPGDYYIEFVKPDGFESSPKNALGLPGDTKPTDSDASPTNGRTDSFTLSYGEAELDIDAGFYQLLSLGNFVWNDINNNGIFDNGESPIPGVSLTLWKDENGDNIPDVSTGKNTTTNPNGEYLFTELVEGDYVVVVNTSNFVFGNALVGFATSTGNNPTPDPDLNDTNNDDNGYDPGLNIGIISYAVTLSAGDEPTNDGDSDANSNLTVDFGFYRPASIGDFVWYDDDGNGIQDNNTDEQGINGVIVRLHDAITGNILQTTITSQSPLNPTEQGYYLFGGLAPGDYYISFETPANHIITDFNEGENSYIDSNIDGTYGIGTTGLISLNPGDMRTDIDAGFYLSAKVGDYVWKEIPTDDSNGALENIQDATDIGVNNVLVKLINNTTGLVVDTQLTHTNPDTGEDGYYMFTGVKASQYYIELDTVGVTGLIPAQNYTQYTYVTPNQGFDDKLDSDIVDFFEHRTLVFTVEPADCIDNIDIGFKNMEIILPVEYELFTGRHNEVRDINELTWVTASEINNDYFEVFRKFENGNWSIIGEVEGVGSSLERETYHFDDENIEKEGVYYYRLNQIDYNGSATLSDQISINVQRKGVVVTNIYPNPASYYLNVNISTKDSDVVSARIFDSKGRLLKQVVNNLEIENQTTLNVDVQDYSAGSYFIEVLVGKQLFNHKFIIVK
jgi:hypothetical protein